MRSSIYGLLLLIMATVGCKSTEAPSLINSPVVSDPDAPTPGVINALGGFNVKPDTPEGASYYMHKDGNFSQSCVVDSAATAIGDRDIMCTLEIEELEGVFHGLNMVLNAPPDMCKYVVYRPYFYFGLPYGNGPTAADIFYDDQGNYLGGVVTAGGANGSISPDGTPLCNYDYTNQNAGVNCCLGQATITKYVNGVLDGTSPYDWGGKPGNCVDGAGATAERDNITNMPINTIFQTEDGLSKAFEVENSLLKGIGSIYFANYFPGTPYIDTFPSPFYLNVFPAAQARYEGNPYYTWTCLDAAYELRARIRVRVREWNEGAQFLLGSLGDPDTTGTEADFPSESLNDYWDWDDYVVGAPPTIPADSFPGISK